ncbi:MAG: outer membrane protein assembly factor BamD, partial [Alphaproteobacteria bacterium]
MARSLLSLLACTAMVVGLTACGGETSTTRIGTVADLYNNGLTAIEGGEYFEAITNFNELERQHPYSGWATRAHMMSAYAQYLNEDLDDAIASTERFIRLHPGHQDLPYMYYLRAMSFYTRISDVKRDQGFTRQALESFEEIERRFPTTTYARDAKFKATLCRDHLAGKEMDVARWYLGQKRYLAAINRFRTVVDTYETSSHTPEALYRLTEAY